MCRDTVRVTYDKSRSRVLFGTPVNESNRGGFFLTIALPLFNFFLPDNEKYIDHEEKKSL
jgi:hypothetical protein